MNKVLDQILRDMRRQQYGSGLSDSAPADVMARLESLRAREDRVVLVRRQYLNNWNIGRTLGS